MDENVNFPHASMHVRREGDEPMQLSVLEEVVQVVTVEELHGELEREEVAEKFEPVGVGGGVDMNKVNVGESGVKNVGTISFRELVFEYAQVKDVG
ncbi:hypothetical protein L1987_80583 [Smallanthus sonchifolius]|uniref:Uncharacterized protein n=1 Tax=Smallanthus sonchifolius TaxID=185202 RepID=A0ACB8YMB1_9ASTR|nr:hypothetical protein L1987_80583 [Smallanthus sonchifolius]